MARHQPAASDDAAPTTRGTVKRLLKDKGFGFVGTSTGVEYFFHGSACAFDFNDLREGDAVTFLPSQGPKGPRAEAVERA